MEDVLVLYPSPAIGHLISMVELAKLILSHHPFFSFKILITSLPFNVGSTAPYIDRVSASIPSITFHHLPSVSVPPISSAHHETLAFEVFRLSNPHVHEALQSISHSCTIRAFIMDSFCFPALAVAADFKIPAYFFFTSGAGCLASFLYLPTIHQNTTKSLKDLDTHLDMPGIPPVSPTDLAKPILDRTDKAYEGFLNLSIHLPKAAGIIVNTFESLEPRALKAMLDGLCVPNEPTPPIYCIGPLIAANDRTGGDECLTWLDSQPSGSVVFLCFGSLGLFSKEQLNEIAVGLERSGQRFLWVVRSPPPEDETRRFLTPPEPDLDLLLPSGFLERTKHRGLVVKSWAPQVAVLNRDSVGGFVTHCGWNSALEAVCAGVPMVAWPLYAEQRFNRVILVEEMKLAVPMVESENGFVKAAEVEKRVKELMESEEGNSIRKRIMNMKEAAKAAHLQMEDALVLYPSPAIGHLISMVELAKLILSHHPFFSFKILITSLPFNVGSTAPYIDRVSASIPSITFHHLPSVSVPPISSAHHETLAFEVFRLSNPHVHEALQSISHSCTIRAFIMDSFCFPALAVAADFKIPAYFFFTSGAGCLASFLYLPTIHQNTTKSLKDLDTHLDMPGIPPVSPTDLAKPILDRTDKAYEGFLNLSIHLPKAAGIIVNTFESLEPRALKAILDGLCVPNDPTPPIYCIGPLIAANDRTGGNECLTWLDSQPSGSVVFLCFGSLGLFSKEQLNEIAVGLERSGQRFLWVVRSPPPEDQTRRFLAPPEPDLDLLLPNGFLERTKYRGLVVKSWAPQVAVLNHDSVGGFVTHCGWNSALEAVCAGVPMVAWPLYAEQRFNRVILVEEMKLALPMVESENGFVKAAEVENRVKELMESEEGNSIGKRILNMKEAAKAAVSDGGSSRVALTKLVESWNRGRGEA
ncbi:hypothetical protein F0562_026665 [Nyssa sinensis]|uniref:UDP-glycosyltransferases domain-containing protein n=1 Tax=Nyssa sinensis TaxID=561372 RepID=A0A5J5BA01_9ASTE|nr:hypothetical protein F0562_026665 [Nyssa sinensis]